MRTRLTQAMLRYYTWALGEQVLWRSPGGKAVYRRAGRIIKRRRQGTGGSFVSSLPVARKVKELARPGATIMEVGTGWFHHDAFLLYLAGDYELVLFDVEDKAWLPYIRNYLRNLLERSSLLARELETEEAEIRAKLGELLTLPTREAIYDRCRFTPLITNEPATQFWPERSVDFMVSNCVLVHIPPEILRPELVALRSMLKDDGYMYHHLGHDDHWAFHDPAVKWPSFNYMRYSERTWDTLFQGFEYHNRLVKPEWIEIFNESGLDVAEYNVHITDDSRAAVAGLPRLDERFAAYDLDDLAVVYSYVLLRKGGSRSPRGRIETHTVSLPTAATC